MQQFGGGRRGNRHDAVRRLDKAATDPQRRAVDLLHAEIMKAEHRAYNVDNCIHGAHFMKMHLVQRHAVHFGFGLAEAFKHQTGFVLYCVRQLRCPDQFQDVGKSPVMVFRCQVHVQMRGPNPPLVDRFDLD